MICLNWEGTNVSGFLFHFEYVVVFVCQKNWWALFIENKLTWM